VKVIPPIYLYQKNRVEDLDVGKEEPRKFLITSNIHIKFFIKILAGVAYIFILILLSHYESWKSVVLREK
jgi:hypothetical protein